MGYDLVKKMHKISKGDLQCSELLPSYNTKSKVRVCRSVGLYSWKGSRTRSLITARDYILVHSISFVS